MRFLMTILLSGCFQHILAQHVKADISNSVKLKENTIYIFCRGTFSKSGLIARKFNIADTITTHTGIGFLNKGRAFIYSVTDNGGQDKNALTIDSIASYIASTDVFFFSVWEADNSLKEFLAMQRTLNGYAKRKLVFDPFFEISADDTLYCSELCAAVLNGLHSEKFIFKPVRVDLNNKLYESYLRRKTFTYYPVDFFELNRNFRLVSRFFFKNNPGPQRPGSP